MDENDKDKAYSGDAGATPSPPPASWSPAPTSRWRAHLFEMFSFDLRSLALFRIVMATLMLADLWNRIPDVEAHYTDFGVLPRVDYITNFMGKYQLSFHMMGGTPFSIYLLMAVQAVFGVLLLIGWRTRLMHFFSWLFLVSFQTRNPYVLQAGDVLFRQLFLWSMFLPLGAHWSVDRAMNTRESVDPPPRAISGAVVFGFIMQVCIVYWYTAALKTGVEWRNGTAVWFALNLDHFATPFAYWLMEYPRIMAFLTHSTFWFEWLGPLLAFFPVAPQKVRLFAVIAFLGLHAGFGIGLKIGLFIFVSMTGWIPFIPSFFWDKLGDWWNRRRAAKNKPLFEATPATYQRLFSRFVPKRLMAPRPYHWRVPRVVPPIAVFLLVYVFLWNNTSISGKPLVLPGIEQKFTSWVPDSFPWPVRLLGFHLPDKTTVGDTEIPLKALGYTLRLDQKWNMFAPRPMTGDGWFVIGGTSRKGKVVNLWGDSPTIDWAKPEWVKDTYTGQRWRKYMMNLWMKDFKKHRRHYGRYLCRKYDRDNPGDKLDTFHMYYMKEETLVDGLAPTECVTLWRHWCTDRGKDVKKTPYADECAEINVSAAAQKAAREACKCDKMGERTGDKWGKCWERVKKKRDDFVKKQGKTKVDDPALLSLISEANAEYDRCAASAPAGALSGAPAPADTKDDDEPPSGN
jgi:hypothetical protein